MKEFLIILLVFLLLIVGIVLYWKSPVRDLNPTIAKNQIVEFFYTPTPPPQKHITVVSYNLGYAYASYNNLGKVLSRPDVLHYLDLAIEKLKELNPDVIVLQEIDFDADRTYRMNQLRYLAQGLEMPFGAYAVNWNKKYLPYPYWPPNKHMGRMVSGQAILSKWPIVKQEITKFKKPPYLFWYKWFYLDRLAQKVTLTVQNKEIIIWNLHLEAFHRQTRNQQANKLIKLIKKEENPYQIIAGDFNAPTLMEVENDLENATYTVITEALLQSDMEFENLKTYPSWKPVEKLDHILFTKEFTLQKSGTLDLPTSDHLPIWVNLKIENSTKKK